MVAGGSSRWKTFDQSHRERIRLLTGRCRGRPKARFTSSIHCPKRMFGSELEVPRVTEEAGEIRGE
jgi:hypothetical protein